MIIGIGLPRTGTRSLSRALDILGFTGSHHCELIGTTKEGGIEDSYRIDNSFYHDIATHRPINSYILTHRPAEEWRSSIFKFNTYEGIDIEHYTKLCKEEFFNSTTELLIFNIIEGWEPLCKFLNVPIPNVDFPSVK